MGQGNEIAICPRCGARNRIPASRRGERAACGKCRAPLPASGCFPEGMVDISDASFSQEVLGFSGPVLLEFWAPWCGHCQRMVPILDQLASAWAGRVKFARLNIDENPRTAGQYGVQGTPTLLFFKDGTLVHRLVGARPGEEIEGQLRRLS